MGITLLVEQVEHLSLEGRFAGQQRIQDNSERIEITTARDRLAGGLLGREELGGADDSACDSQMAGGEQSGDAEIGDLRVPGEALYHGRSIGRQLR